MAQYMILKRNVHYFYEIVGLREDGVVETKFKEFRLFNVAPNIPRSPPLEIAFPPEINVAVLEILCCTFLYNRDFRRLFEMTKINTYLLHYVYCLIYPGMKISTIRRTIKRVGGTLHFLYEVNDNYLCDTYLSEPLKPSLSIKISSIFKEITPWNLDISDPMMIDRLDTTRLLWFEDIKSFSIGPCVQDKVWLVGDYDEEAGVFGARKTYHPVLCFTFYRATGSLVEKNLMKRNQWFKRLTKLLRIIYGPSTGVFYVVEDEKNPFHIQNAVLELY